VIPLREQEAIQQKFAMELAGSVKIDYFTERNLGLTVPGKTPCQYCKPTREMLQELAGLHDALSLRLHYFEDNPEEKSRFGVERVPGIVLRGSGGAFVKFYGLPGGTEFGAFVESIVDISRGEVLFSEESVQTLTSLTEDVTVRVFVTPTCPYCPAMMRAAFQMAMVSPRVHAETIEVNEFPDLADKYKVHAVPLTVINDTVAMPGMVQERDFVAEVAKAGKAGAKPDAAEGPASEAPAQPRKKIERGKQRESGLYIP
jgi:glutaredoxin-like protein